MCVCVCLHMCLQSSYEDRNPLSIETPVYFKVCLCVKTEITRYRDRGILTQCNATLVRRKEKQGSGKEWGSLTGGYREEQKGIRDKDKKYKRKNMRAKSRKRAIRSCVLQEELENNEWILTHILDIEWCSWVLKNHVCLQPFFKCSWEIP